jgi:alkanesulfonate monooxygenase SsuD/methylene tetrahydromethanopterin reductase-like flavin-dependent oxidoreductase (luciferase family)
VVELSFKTPQQKCSWRELRAFWLEAERMGVWRGGWLFDHLRPAVGDGSGDCLEGWTALAALGEATEHLRLGLLVSPAFLRPPALIAKSAATLDVITGGRVNLGLGAGWNDAEACAFGVPFPGFEERASRLDETCAITRGLLGPNESFDFVGRYYELHGAACYPKPVQSPRIPIVVGGSGKRGAIPIAARWADGWNYLAGEVEEFARASALFHEACAVAGRDPESIELSVQVPADERLAERAQRFVEAGADHLVVSFSAPFLPEALESAATALVGRLDVEVLGR